MRATIEVYVAHLLALLFAGRRGGQLLNPQSSEFHYCLDIFIVYLGRGFCSHRVAISVNTIKKSGLSLGRHMVELLKRLGDAEKGKRCDDTRCGRGSPCLSLRLLP